MASTTAQVLTGGYTQAAETYVGFSWIFAAGPHVF
jgi:hypothetical protein